MLSMWNPANDVERILDDMDELLTRTIGSNRIMSRMVGFRPATDIYETNDHLVVKLTLAGVDPQKVDITLEQNTLTIRAPYGYQADDDGVTPAQVTWYRREIGAGQFAESFTLPVPVDTDRVEATFDNGILTLTMPKAEQARTRKIAVQPLKALSS